MISTTLSTVIGAPRERVWRALTSPEELVRWDDRLLRALDPADGYPEVGRCVRWRYQLGAVPIVVRERPLEVVPPERLRSDLSLGLLRMDETFALGVDTDAPDRTHVALRLVSASSVPVVGGLLDRFTVRRLATELADTRLSRLREWCEEKP